jgi:hypothetical protein
MKKETCAICGCELHRGGDYAKPTAKHPGVRSKNILGSGLYCLTFLFLPDIPDVMARPLRIEYPGAVCRLTSRGTE